MISKSFVKLHKKLLVGPDRQVTGALKSMKSGAVLDLGCGDGRNALYLAKKGFDVTGIDISSKRIKDFKRFAKRLNVNAKVVKEDARKFKFDKNYDAIISMNVLHFFTNNEIYKLIAQMKRHTKNNGINAMTVSSFDVPSKRYPSLPKNKLKKLYHNWKILHYKEYIERPRPYIISENGRTWVKSPISRYIKITVQKRR